ncbi:MAG: DUF1413 domain-containing protein [Alkalibacterium gilvum]|uniref:Uncharacterized protein n=1 Tax=Alkalibacterium gilvum TaxID=1130080 RepID=A0A1H6SCU6_9LACT|nr:DUF1413 domain-containing protein [Alkalibacterium gilvum]SEI62577.1 protein of unknown function [Alkalibacterium gilvum]HAJ70159.1 DUF1413 domain-containing protein [Alkalibacterium sp.]
MELSAISKQLKNDVKDMILEERINFLNDSIEQGFVEDGYEFELKDLFLDNDWKGVYEWPGNWRLGSAFASTVKNYPHIIKAGKNKEGHSLYKINKSKFSV